MQDHNLDSEVDNHGSEVETVTINKFIQPASNNIASLPFQMPSFSPLLNNNSIGTMNFTVKFVHLEALALVILEHQMILPI